MKPMKYDYGYVAYVSSDGNYGVDNTVTFNVDEFYDRYPKAWEQLDEMADSDRLDFLIAVLDQDIEQLEAYAEDYGIRLKDLLDKE